MHQHPTEFASKVWLTDNAKVQQNMLPGQTLAYTMDANSGMNNADYVSVLGYASKVTLAKHSDCEGKHAEGDIKTSWGIAFLPQLVLSRITIS